MRRVQFEVDPEMCRNLRLICVWAQWKCEVGFQVLDRNRLVVFDLHALGSIGKDGHDLGAEHSAPACFFYAALAHLQKPWVDRLGLELRVNLFSTFSFEDHRRNPRWTIPHCKVGDGSTTGQRKNVIALLDSRSVVGEYLPHKDFRISV